MRKKGAIRAAAGRQGGARKIRGKTRARGASGRIMRLENRGENEKDLVLDYFIITRRRGLCANASRPFLAEFCGRVGYLANSTFVKLQLTFV